jgi:hypothetical protein
MKRVFEAMPTLRYRSISMISSKTEFHAIMGVSTRSKPDNVSPWSFEKKNRFWKSDKETRMRRRERRIGLKMSCGEMHYLYYRGSKNN